MPFKLVAIIDSSLSLGSILSIDGVHAVSIDTLPDKQIKEKPISKKQYTKTQKFFHPDKKRVIDFIIEYLQQHKTAAEWGELGDFISKQGFHKSSVNNGIARLIKLGQVIKVGSGKYTLNQKNTS